MKLTGYLAYLLRSIPSDRISIITPSDPKQRGAQLSVSIQGSGKSLHEALTAQDIITDWREPDVIRVAPAPLYNSYAEVYGFVETLASLLTAVDLPSH